MNFATNLILVQTDVFPVYSLSYNNFGIRREESAIHIKGCKSLLAFWRNNPSIKPKSDILESFESLLWSWIDFFYGFCDVEVLCQRITFAENFKSFERLKYYTGTPTDVWKSTYLITTHVYLGYPFTMSLSWLQVVAFNKEQRPDLRENQLSGQWHSIFDRPLEL